MADRTPRTTETREKTERKKGWSRPSALPTPEPRDGLHFRWIRTSTLGQSDNTNVSTRFREGYTPVKASDHSDLNIVSDIDSRFKCSPSSAERPFACCTWYLRFQTLATASQSIRIESRRINAR